MAPLSESCATRAPNTTGELENHFQVVVIYRPALTRYFQKLFESRLFANFPRQRDFFDVVGDGRGSDVKEFCNLCGHGGAVARL